MRCLLLVIRRGKSPLPKQPLPLLIGGGGEQVPPTVFGNTGNNAVVDWATQQETPVLTSKALNERVLAHALPAGSAVRPADLRARLWFAAGDTVRVEAKGEGFSVSTTAQALGPGAEGQRVRVRTEAGQVLTGLAVGAHRVEVSL